MYPFRKILFPVDYSKSGDDIVPHIKEMAHRFSAGLTCVHAYGAEALAFSELPFSDPGLAEEARVREEQRLRQYALETFPGQHVETFAELGEPGSIIRGVIEREGTDLVMMPTHGRGPIRRFLLGSVAAKVIHDVSAAVWTGAGNTVDSHTAQVPYESILCALDDSDEAEVVLTAAAALACDYRSQLHIVRVVEVVPTSLDFDFEPYRMALEEAAEFHLRELKGRLNVHAPHLILSGPVAIGVREEAIRCKADLVITGRGRSQDMFNRIWSDVYPIVREAPCPVLSI